jgi:UDP-N-acetylglucosamine--N-acetylmuramyl-(pentapeptide) pyrophosphoryl-undecaprenol N-acetylglucosamine transferase
MSSTGSEALVDGERKLRLAIAGGGTGGHVLPGISVVQELQRRDALADVLWIGSYEGQERETATAAGIRYVSIPTGKLRRYVSVSNLIDMGRVPAGVVAARQVLRSFRPQVVFSTGGFVSVPSVIAARRIAPVVTHEQTAIVGLANRINARFADVLAISHRESEAAARKLHRRVELTGNPIRTGLVDGDRARGLEQLGFTTDLPVLYVTGGARGASALNERIGALLPELLPHIQILHQTGPTSANQDGQRLRQMRAALTPELQRRYALREFIGAELPDVYAAADLVLGRAGAGTVAELAYVGLPAILIPLPGAGGDEQLRNAQVLAGAGAAVVLPQAEATIERLRDEIVSLASSRERREAMSAGARSVAQPRAAANLADLLLAMAGEN